MPELPEVEAVVRALKMSPILGKTLSSIQISCPKIPSEIKTLTSQSIQHIERRGKYIHFHFTQKIHLLVHLRMTGKFLLKKSTEAPAKHERVLFYFSEGVCLAFHDARRFGTFAVTLDPSQFLSKLGPEPLESSLSPERFFQIFSSRKKAIKAALLDQTLLVGVGNIYADEALWEAKLHPERPCCELSKQESFALLKALRTVLDKGIAQGGTSLGTGAPNFQNLNGQSGKNQQTLNVYGKQGASCLRCGTLLKRITLVQRGTCFCPFCQKKDS